ncbi:MAG TPA: hypothetical protein VHC22_14230 [Pirellulales bacterium]|nr:hypothetical protein [Pirellulales bacterium]
MPHPRFTLRALLMSAWAAAFCSAALFLAIFTEGIIRALPLLAAAAVWLVDISIESRRE